MFSFLNFSFEFDSPRDNPREVESVGSKGAGVKQWGPRSNVTSPMSSTSAGTPKTIPLLYTPPPARTLIESPVARPAEFCAAQEVKKRSSARKRRSSVFFKLPDLDKVLHGGNGSKGKDATAAAAGNKQVDKKYRADGGAGSSLATKLTRPSSRRRSRRASIAPGGESPRRTRGDRTAKDTIFAVNSVRQDPHTGVAAAAAAVVAKELSNEAHDEREAWSKKPCEDALAAWEEEGSTVKSALKDPPDQPRGSPRALSAGHRRESCRDGGISRAPKGLTAARLLEDAQDVARIRSVARLRATYQGVCWIASNWRVGEKKGVLSGRRYLVLCDNIVWAELREADRCSSVGNGAGDGKASMHKQAGFLPIISMNGAIVQHCEVATSNNGWIIEVVNPATDVTLWLDPDNPTSLLRWGSVLCQALATSGDEDEEDIDDRSAISE